MLRKRTGDCEWVSGRNEVCNERDSRQRGLRRMDKRRKEDHEGLSCDSKRVCGLQADCKAAAARILNVDRTKRLRLPL